MIKEKQNQHERRGSEGRGGRRGHRRGDEAVTESIFLNVRLMMDMIQVTPVREVVHFFFTQENKEGGKQEGMK